MSRIIGTALILITLSLGSYGLAPVLFTSTVTSSAQLANPTGVPGQISHQGVITVGGTRYTGTGQFYFALIDPDGPDTNLWTNDGSNLGANARPATSVALTVADGIYSVQLGDTDAGMSAIPATVFEDNNVRLRIWFADGVNGVQQLSPDHLLATSPYAYVSALAIDVADGAITSDKLASDIGVWTQAGTQMSYSEGNVGIGTTDPQYLLDVDGLARLGGGVLRLKAGNNGSVSGDTYCQGYWASWQGTCVAQKRVSDGEYFPCDQQVNSGVMCLCAQIP